MVHEPSLKILEATLNDIMKKGYTTSSQDMSWVIDDISCLHAFHVCMSTYDVIKQTRKKSLSPEDLKSAGQSLNFTRQLRELELTDKIDEFIEYLEKKLRLGVFIFMKDQLADDPAFDTEGLFQYLVGLELGTLEELNENYQIWSTQKAAS